MAGSFALLTTTPAQTLLCLISAVSIASCLSARDDDDKSGESNFNVAATNNLDPNQNPVAVDPQGNPIQDPMNIAPVADEPLSIPPNNNDVLTEQHECSPNLIIRHADLGAGDLDQACAIMMDEEAWFHDAFGSKGKPVPDDNNAQLRANIYSSQWDYQSYAPEHFNIPTNNGGMYIEGSPSQAGNIGEFVAFYDGGSVKNLAHEFVHYLDGRYNIWGGWCDGLHDDHDAPENCPQPTPDFPHTVWWAEGVAEYVSKESSGQGDIWLSPGGYSLSELFHTSYNENGGQDRIYFWSHGAVKFMMENHRDETESMLKLLRTADFDGYQSLVESWGTSFDAEFDQWLSGG